MSFVCFFCEVMHPYEPLLHVIYYYIHFHFLTGQFFQGYRGLAKVVYE